MNPGRFRFLFLVVLASLSVVSSAPRALGDDAPTPPPVSSASLSLTIQDAVRMALQDNPSLQSDREKVNQADKNISYTKSLFFPNISADGTAERLKDTVNSSGGGPFDGSPYNQYEADLKLTQPIYAGGALHSGLAVAKATKEINARTLEADQRDLTVQVIEAFYTTMVFQRVLDILVKTKDVEGQTVATTQRYYKIGRSQLLDVLQAKTTLALLVPQITSAQNQVKNAASQLLTFLHRNQEREVNLVGEIPYIDPERVNSYLAQRKELPEIVRGETAIEQSRQQTTLTLSTYHPQLSLEGAIGRKAFTQSDLLNDYSTEWSIGLTLTVPIFAGLGSIYQRAALNSVTQQLEYTQSQLLDTLSLSQVEAQRNLAAATIVLKSSHDADELSKASLKEAQRDFRLQTINYLQFLTSQQNYLSAESSFIQAKFGYIDAVAKFFQSSGIPMTELVAILGK